MAVAATAAGLAVVLEATAGTEEAFKSMAAATLVATGVPMEPATEAATEAAATEAAATEAAATEAAASEVVTEVVTEVDSAVDLAVASSAAASLASSAVVDGGEPQGALGKEGWT
ncbi:uncharacterized protein LOC144175014 [Haemaphysalis longicornis]